MSALKRINGVLFRKYEHSDLIARSSAKFLFTLAFLFFLIMFAHFFINISNVGFIKALVTGASSCLFALITMVLIKRGRLKTAGAFFATVQSLVLVAGAASRTPELTLVTIVYFAFPTVILAAVFAPRWIQWIVITIIMSLLTWNTVRFSSVTSNVTAGVLPNLVRAGTIAGIATMIITYAVSYFTMRSMTVAIRVSGHEAKANREKTNT